MEIVVWPFLDPSDFLKVCLPSDNQLLEDSPVIYLIVPLKIPQSSLFFQQNVAFVPHGNIHVNIHVNIHGHIYDWEHPKKAYRDDPGDQLGPETWPSPGRCSDLDQEK